MNKFVGLARHYLDSRGARAGFGSRLEFCRATGVDPGQLTRVFVGRADLSLRALQNVLAVLQAPLSRVNPVASPFPPALTAARTLRCRLALEHP